MTTTSSKPKPGTYLKVLADRPYGTTEKVGAILKVTESKYGEEIWGENSILVEISKEAKELMPETSRIKERGWWFYGYWDEYRINEIHVPHTRKRKSLIK